MNKKVVNKNQFRAVNTRLCDIKEIFNSEILFKGARIMVGGFGLCGNPEALIDEVVNSEVNDLTIISNNCGTEGNGLGKLLETKQIKKLIASYVGENKLLSDMMIKNEIDVELIPQGNLAERINAEASGTPAFYSRVGIGTEVQANKEIRLFGGKEYMLEYALAADIALIKGHKADSYGNVIYNGTARNFNPVMARAAKFTICEVEEIVEGAFDPNFIHTPGIFVNILVVANYQKKIENKASLDN